MPMAADLDIIIVNWNSGIQLRDCLLSIREHGADQVRQVVVVDNASVDHSLNAIECVAHPVPTRVIHNTENKGFARACNQGAELSQSKYLLFLNPDARLLNSSLSAPLAFLNQKEHSNVGICGIQLIDENGHVSRTCARYPSVGMFAVQALGLSKLSRLKSLSHHMDEWDHGSTCEVDHVIGAFYWIRRSLFESLGGFDERFFVYLEDLDLSLRARQAGWKSVFLAEAQAFHAGGGTSEQVKALRLFYSLRSRLQYGFKHFSYGQVFLLLGVTLLIEPVSRAIFSLARGGIEDLRNTLNAYRMLGNDLGFILKQGLRLS